MIKDKLELIGLITLGIGISFILPVISFSENPYFLPIGIVLTFFGCISWFISCLIKLIK